MEAWPVWYEASVRAQKASMETSYEESFNLAHPKTSLPHSQKANCETVKAGAGHLHSLSQTGWDASLPSESRGQGWTTLPPDRHGRA